MYPHRKSPIWIWITLVSLMSLGLSWLFNLSSVSALASLNVPTPPACRLPWLNGTDMASIQLVYNSQDNEFVGLAMKYFDTVGLGGGIQGSDIDNQLLVALRLSHIGEPIKTPTELISETFFFSPANLIYHPPTNRYLLAWISGGSRGSLDSLGTGHIKLLSPRLELSNESHLLQTLDAYWIAPAYNSDDDEFGVAWLDEAESVTSPGPGLYWQRVDAEGVPIPHPIFLTPRVGGRGQMSQLKLLYNPTAHEYLLTWLQQGSAAGVYSLRISRTGEPLGNPQQLVGPSVAPNYPKVALNSTDHRYLLVWSEAHSVDNRLIDVYGRLLSSQGTPLGEPFVVRGTARYERPIEVVYNPVRQEYLVAFDADEKDWLTETDIKPSLQRISPQGVVVGEAIQTEGGVFGLGVNPTTGEYLALERFGFQAKQWGNEPRCFASPTPTGTRIPQSPRVTPNPFVVQRRMVVRDINPGHAGSWQWLVDMQANGVRFEEVVHLTQQSRLDETLGPVGRGAELWLTVHYQQLYIDNRGPVFMRPLEYAAVLAPGMTLTPTTTHEPNETGTPTATTTPTPSRTTTPGATLTRTPTMTATVAEVRTVTPTSTPTSTSTPTPTATRAAPLYPVYLPAVVRGTEP